MANNKIILKKSAVVGKVPQTTDLEYGELAINYADGVLYYKTSANNVAALASGTGGGPAGDATITISAGSGLTTGGDFTTNQTSDETITIDHADTSSQASVDNSNGNVIQDITLDEFGHITSIGSVDLDSRYITQSDIPYSSVGRWTSTDDTTDYNGTALVSYDSQTITDVNIINTSSTRKTVTEAGLYEIHAEISYTSSSERVNVGVEILINGVSTGTLGRGGYIRNANGHDEASSDVLDIVNLNANDYIEIQTTSQADSGTVNLEANRSNLTIKKLGGVSQTLPSTLDTVTTSGNTTTNSIEVGSVQVGSTTQYDSDTATVSTTFSTEIATFSASTYNGGKLIVQITDTVSGERQISELLVTHDDTDAYATEYSVVYTGSAPLAEFDVDISGGNVRLLATGASSNSTEYKVTEILTVA